MTRLTGRCLCGATTLTITPAERHIHACHCGMCRSWTSSAFMGLSVAPDDLEHLGPVRASATSDWAERAWCDGCGSALWYRVTAPGPYSGVYHVAAGLFEGAGAFPMNGELYIDKKPAGYAFAGDHKTYTEAQVQAMFAPDERGTP
ncbi:MAG: GFA family protein [Pseudomonadota bacterium]